jgi:hydroxylamine reductase (hybrid-cluster protein)
MSKDDMNNEEVDEQMDDALREIMTKALEIRDIANRETEQGRMAGPTHRAIFEATGKVLDIIPDHLT